MTTNSAVYPLVIEKMPFEQYVELPGEHSTLLKCALVSAKEYDHHKRNERADTDSFRIGRAAHTAALEPARFLREYALMPEGMIRRGAKWDEFEAMNEGKTILKSEQYDLALAMAESMRSHEVSGPLLTGAGRNELTIRWRHASGALCKARIDRLCGAVVDLKTAADISEHGFQAAAWRLGYFMQMAFYADAVAAAGLGSLPAKIITVQKSAPHDVVVYDVDPSEIEAGREDYEKALALVAECTKSGKWPGRAPVAALTLRRPAWAMSAFDEDAADAIDFGSEAIQ